MRSNHIPHLTLVSYRGGRPVPPQHSGATNISKLRVEEFLQARSLSANTTRAYRRELHRFLDWAELSWSQVDGRDLAKYRIHLSEQTLAPSSRNRAIAALKAFFKWMTLAYPTEVPVNACQAIFLETLPDPPPNDFNPEDVAAMVAAIEWRERTRVRDRALVAVLAHGLRRAEVSALNVEDYDGIRLTIRQAKADSTGRVPLKQTARELVDDYLRWRDAQIEEEWDGERPLFVSLSPGRVGERLGVSGIYKIVKGLGGLAGIENPHPHRFRHAYAVELILSGLDSMHARKLTRHKSESSFRRYTTRGEQVAAEQAYFKAMGETIELDDLPDIQTFESSTI
ncbi:MAG: tyrosine-type recombinase/integrase [Cyanobacteria bacterium J06642_2]